MMDPPRLRSRSGSLESLLLRSAPSFEPPPSAEEEVWRKLRPLTAIGAAAAATTVGTHAAAGSNLAGKTLWLSLLKWGAVVAVAGPTVAGTTHWALHRHDAAVVALAHDAAPARAQRPEGAAVPAPPPMDPPSAATVDPPATSDPPRPVAVHHPAHGGHGAAVETPSALQAESRLLASARARLASGDPQGALDDVGRLMSHFPRGKLAQEREVVAIDSLAALGNHQGARSRGLAFLERFPDGPYAAHVRQVIEP